MVGVRHSLSAGELYTIVCRARGSRPPPSISWRLGAEDVSSLVTELVTSSDGVTSSSLQLRARPRHHGQLLSCEAAVPGLASAGRLDSASVLNVHHLGPASLQLGRDLASPVREGEDAYLECEVEANPRPSKVAIVIMLSQLHDIYQTNPAFKKKNLSQHFMFQHCQPMRNHHTEQLQGGNGKINSEKVSGQLSSIQLVSPYIISP